MQSEQLPTESPVFEDEVLAGAKRADNPPEEMPDRNNHGKNIIGTIRIQLCAKSFILQVYNVLARHSLSACPLIVEAIRLAESPDKFRDLLGNSATHNDLEQYGKSSGEKIPAN